MVVLVAALLVVISGPARPAAAATPSTAGGYVPLSPARVLDTRYGVGAPRAVVGPGRVVPLTVAGAGGVPASGVSAVVLNVTATQPTAAGYVSVYPDGESRPTVSNLNYVAGQTGANLVVASVAGNGKVDLYNGSSGSVQLVADVSGYYLTGTADQPGTFTPLTPARVLDTRYGVGAPTAAVGPGQTVVLSVEGAGGVPTSGVSAVALNVTVTQPSAPGYITVSPHGAARPTASNLNFVARQTVPNLVMASLGSGGEIDLYNGSTGTVQLIADVFGYDLAGVQTQAGTFNPLSPNRVLDTRTGLGAYVSPVAAGHTLSLQISGAGGVPASGVSAVVLNVTATQPTAAGYVTVYPHGAARPTASNLNYTAHQTVPNLVIAPVGSGGEVDFYNGSTGSVQLIADVAGWYLSDRQLSWGTAHYIDRASGGFASVSCPTPSFCAAIDNSGWATVFTGGAWTAPVPVFQPVPGMKRGSMSCVSSTYCVTIDADTASVYNGSRWSAGVRAPANSGDLISISCTSTTQCLTIASGGEVIPFSGTSWGTPTFMPQGENLGVLSCPTIRVCVAVDAQDRSATYTNGTWSTPVPTGAGLAAALNCPTETFCVLLDNTGNASTFNGTSWSAAVRFDTAATPLPEGVSCASATYCVALDRSGISYTFDGSQWSSGDSFDPSDVSDVSCPTSTFCMVVDSAGRSLTQQAGVWGAPDWADPAGGEQIEAISCPTPTFCAAADHLGNVLTYDGSTWTPPNHIDAPHSYGPLTAIVCTSASFCLTIDTAGGAFSFDGSKWTATNSTSDTGLAALACASPTFCVAGDNNGNTLTYNGTQWGPLIPTHAWVYDYRSISSLACPSSTYCLAVDVGGESFRFDGTSWSGPVLVTPNRSDALSSISCATTSFCLAIDQGGTGYVTTNGYTWTATAETPGIQATAVSCLDGATCEAVGQNGVAMTYDGAGWSPLATIPGTSNLTGVACLSDTRCIAIDDTGHYVATS